MKRGLCVFAFIISLLVVLVGCDNPVDQSINVPTTQPVATGESNNRIAGIWKIESVYADGDWLRVRGTPAESIYDATFITFNDEGEYSYIDRWIYSGTYRPHPEKKNSYLLETDKLLDPYLQETTDNFRDFIFNTDSGVFGEYDSAADDINYDFAMILYRDDVVDGNGSEYVSDEKMDLNESGKPSDQHNEYGSNAETVKCSMCNGIGSVKYYYGGSAIEAFLDGYNDYEYGLCTSCKGTGYITVIPQNHATDTKKEICPSCGNYVTKLVKRSDNAGVRRYWCDSCWSSYDKIMGN